MYFRKQFENLRDGFAGVFQLVQNSTQNLILDEVEHANAQQNSVVVTVQMFAVILVQVGLHVVLFVGDPLDAFWQLIFLASTASLFAFTAGSRG